MGICAFVGTVIRRSPGGEARQAPLKIHVSVFILLALTYNYMHHECRLIKPSLIRSFKWWDGFALILIECGADNRSILYFDIGAVCVRLKRKTVLHPVFVVSLLV